jgi:cytochrome c-type biogenesis protein CcmH/NrfG
MAKALSLVTMQDLEGLLAHARQWVNAQPKNADAWINLGVAYGNLNQGAKAVDTLQQALRLNPEHAKAWYNLGVGPMASSASQRSP